MTEIVFNKRNSVLYKVYLLYLNLSHQYVINVFQSTTIPPEILPKLKHTHKGTLSMAVAHALENHKGGCGTSILHHTW